jgi:plastocyanin
MRAPLASYLRCLLLLVCLLGAWTLALAQRISVSGSVEVSKASEGKAVDQSNVAIWLVPLSTAAQATASSEPSSNQFVLNQRNKTFTPHLLVVPVGAAVNFPNHDPLFHNVFSLFEGKRFDLGLYEAGSSRTIRFDRAGVSYIFCNIHPEMGAVVIALRTPYYAISDRKGKIALSDVPAGRYVLHIWHEAAPPEMLNAMRREVTISGEASSLGTIRLQLPRAQNVAHKNKYGQDYPKPPSGLYEQR